MKHPKWLLTKRRLAARAARDMVRCKECNSEYNRDIYPLCPYCGINRVQKGGQ